MKWKKIALLLLAVSVCGTAGFVFSQAPQQKEDSPRPSGTNGMQSMMPMMPMMMHMHRRQAVMNNQWKATEDAVYVLQSGRLRKLNPDNLEVVKTVELPKQENSTQAESETSSEDPQQQSEGKSQPPMQQMMAKMQSQLPAKIEIGDGRVFVSQGSTIFRYDRDLNLQARSQLPAPSAQGMMRCPMCGRMMQQRMKQRRERRGPNN